jgi:ABC-type branched-subunit amino acid transport system ATPase component
MLLEARAVTKAFGSFKAVDAASVTLEQGEINLLQLPHRRPALDLRQSVVRRP